MKFMGLATTACFFIIVTFLLPFPATAAPTLYIFSQFKDTLTNIGGFLFKIPKLLIAVPGGDHEAPSHPRAKVSSPTISPIPLVPSFGVRRLK